MAIERGNRCNWLIPVVLLLLLTQALAKPNSPPIVDLSQFNESCGINMKCIPRYLCKDNIINGDASKINTPKIGQAQCSRVLSRCCLVKQEDKEDSQP